MSLDFESFAVCEECKFTLVDFKQNVLDEGMRSSLIELFVNAGFKTPDFDRMELTWRDVEAGKH